MIQHIFTMVSGWSVRRVLPTALLVLLVFGLCAGTAAAAGTLTVVPVSETADEGGSAIAVTITEKPYNAALTLTAVSSNDTVATVIAAGQAAPGVLSYQIIPGTAGSAMITFTSGDGLEGTFTLTVSSAPPVAPTVDAITLSPVSATAAPESTVIFSAFPTNSTTGPISGKTVTWSDGTSTGSADADYHITYTIPAAATGSIQITCSCEGKTATFSISVGQPALQSITLVPSRDLSTAVGHIDSFSVTAAGNDGYVFGPDEITWTVANGTLLEKTGGSGADAQFVTKDADGTTTITASAGEISSALTVAVGTGVPPAPTSTQTPSPTVSPSNDNGGADDGAELLASVGGQKPGATPTTSPTVSPASGTGGDSGITAPGTTGGDDTPGSGQTVSPTGTQTTQSTTPPPTTTRGPVPLFGILAGLGAAVVVLGRKYR